ncbi:spermatogenic leucine zipper protein 1 [Microtus pennsylvanicus]|uniref:spermatogenic leucine zipper protein 1 n=1 Tax=Microtus pennsylvanicus TaxID=10058 RepID=UPI003F6D3161
MANSDISAEMPAPPQTPNPCAQQGSPEPSNPGITISLLEIGSVPPFCWASSPPPNNSIRPLQRPRVVHKFSNLLRDIKDVLKSIAGVEEPTTEVRETFDDASTPENMSEPKIRDVGRRNKMQFKDRLFNFYLEKEESTMKQEMLLSNQSTKNMMQAYARDLYNSEEKRDCSDMQLSMGRGPCGYFHVCGEYRRFRNNMEQLLEEADHWSRQHNELSEIMKSYQECQKESIEASENNQVCLKTQPNNEIPTQQELEAQVKKLSHDTHSLHLIAALLENECQILQQRVDILSEFHLLKGATQHERPLQVYFVHNRKYRRSEEADRMEAGKQPMRAKKGMIPRKEKIYRNSDAYLTKKARKNHFNTHVARKSLLGKRRTINNIR